MNFRRMTAILLPVAGILLLVTCASTSTGTNEGIVNVIAITEVFPGGQRLTGAAIEYGKDIDTSKLTISSFSVDGRTVQKIYANDKALKAAQGVNGKYVIIELSPDDSNAAVVILDRQETGVKTVITEAKILVTQREDVFSVSGSKYTPPVYPVGNNMVSNMIVDDFLSFEFKFLNSDDLLKYNLFIPKDYDKTKSYPLVLFIHDAGTTSEDVRMTLVQGIGAVIWAAPSEQEKHECFVLAPQFTGAGATENLETIYALIKHVIDQYNIDEKRVYTTGQSMGCMASIALNIKYPDLFAASLLVAGQWDAEAMSVLVNKNMWILVSAGDQRAFPGMNASIEVLRAAGARISQAVWNGRATEAEASADVSKMIAEGNNIKYSIFREGTVVPNEEIQDSGNNHTYTWRLAYAFPGVRDWLFTNIKQ